MTPVSTQSVIDALRWRYATKKFDASRKIPHDTWAALEHALVLSPSSMGLQPWKFIRRSTWAEAAARLLPLRRLLRARGP